MLQRPVELRQVFALFEILLFQQVFNPAGLLYHDRYGIVDFMGNTGGQHSQRCQLFSLHELQLGLFQSRLDAQFLPHIMEEPDGRNLLVAIVHNGRV